MEYNRCSPDLLELAGLDFQDSHTEGVYIHKVYPNSCFTNPDFLLRLQEGDILMRILFEDRYQGHPEAFDVLTEQEYEGVLIKAAVDR